MTANKIRVLESIHYTEPAALFKTVKAMERILPPPGSEILYFCIGTDNSTGDCFGPLTGTLLKRMGHKNVMGTLDDPIHAKNLKERLSELPGGKFVVALDATMGSYKNVGQMEFRLGPVIPGAAFDRQLPPVGDSSVVFNSAPFGPFNMLALNCASLNKVWTGCNLLAGAISVIAHRRKKAAASESYTAGSI